MIFFVLAVAEQPHPLAAAFTRKQNRARAVAFCKTLNFLSAPWHAFTLSMALPQIIPKCKLRFVRGHSVPKAKEITYHSLHA